MNFTIINVTSVTLNVYIKYILIILLSLHIGYSTTDNDVDS